jgi:hypothetical protein
MNILKHQLLLVFTKIMRRLRFEEGKKIEPLRLTYLPMTWGKMVSFLSYCISRDDLKKEINQKDKVGGKQNLYIKYIKIIEKILLYFFCSQSILRRKWIDIKIC